jgi:hypothetical protein
MTEAQWLVGKDPEMMKKVLPSGNSRKRRLFACVCCRRGWNLFTEESCQELEMAECLADGTAKRKQLDPIREAAERAYQEAPPDETRSGRDQRHTAWMACRHASGAEIIRAAFNSAILMSELLGMVAAGPLPNDGMGPHNQESRAWNHAQGKARRIEKTWQAEVLRDIFGNPFLPITINPAVLAWNNAIIVRLARTAYDERQLPSGTLDEARLAILADALEEAGCTDPDILGHLRGHGPHVRGCWALDLVLGLS